MTVLKKINCYEHFGDTSVRNRAERQTTVVAAERVLCAVLDLESYHRLIAQNCEIAEIVQEMRRSPLLRHLPSQVVEGLRRNAHYEEYTLEQAVYEQFDAPKNIYYIMRGDIELRKKQIYKVNDSSLLASGTDKQSSTHLSDSQYPYFK